jgi:hypothetical protein
LRADRWLTDHEFLELAADVERIGGALAMSTDAGLVPMGRGFTEIAEQIRRGGTIPPELVEHYATLTRGVRALHGGHVAGVGPGEGGWISLDRR